MNRRTFLKNSTLSLAALGASNTLLNADEIAPSSEALFPNEFISPDGIYTLPPLPYEYNALEPYIDEQTMKIHHDIHFLSYTNGLNDTLKALELAREKNDFTQINNLQSQLSFNGAGYMLHRIFFAGMNRPNASTPSKYIIDILNKHFQGIESFKAHFNAAALNVQGSGWAILGYQAIGRKFIILQVEKHQNATLWNIIPILALDVWEHAYYLKYQNRRKDYIQNWWNIVNWKEMEKKLKTIEFLTQSNFL